MRDVIDASCRFHVFMMWCVLSFVHRHRVCTLPKISATGYYCVKKTVVEAFVPVR